MALTQTPYQRAVGILEAVEARGMLPGLERIDALLTALDRPQRGLRGVLVAGTNGKGSVCACIDSVARAAGLHVVTLTKPHLQSYCERIAVDGKNISEQRFADVIEAVDGAARMLPEALQPTAFEMLTAAGIEVARREAPDLVVCEVGLGGRLDSTNILDLGVAAITNVGLDHRDRLGDTVAEIAVEKAAIIKAGNRAVTGATGDALQAVRARAQAVQAELREAHPIAAEDRGFDGVALRAAVDGHELQITAPLLGAFQLDNVAVAAGCCAALRGQGLALSDQAIVEGLANVRWPGRMQWIAGRPPLLLDGAHNPPSMAALVQSARGLLAGRRVVVVLAAMRDKDVAAMVVELRGLDPALVLCTAPEVARSTRPDELAGIVGAGAVPVPGVAAALEQARTLAGEHGAVLVCGSLYLVGEALSSLGGG